MKVPARIFKLGLPYRADKNMRKQIKATALVTGGAKRLGHAVALHLAEQGYNIAIHYHKSKDEAMKTAEAIYKKGRRCELFSCNLAKKNRH